MEKVEAYFYVYQHLRADTREVFYVGKGKGKRLTSRGRNEYWKRIVQKHGLIVELIAEGLTEEEAFILEVSTIKNYRERGLKLANMTEGGEGTVGRIVTEESRVNYRLSRLGEKNPMHGKTHDADIKEKIRKASIVNHAKPEVKAKIKDALTGLVRTDEVKEKIRQARIGTKRSDETKAKISEIKKGKPSKLKGTKLSDGTKEKLRQANLGKRYSEETKLKVSQASKGRVMSDEAKAKISAANKGKPSNRKGKTGFSTSEETKELLRLKNLGKTLSEETKRKMSEAQKAAHARGKRVVSEETKAKIRAKLLGKKLSEETRQKMSASRKLIASKNDAEEPSTE